MRFISAPTSLLSLGWLAHGRRDGGGNFEIN
jgi:hypothetical protein